MTDDTTMPPGGGDEDSDGAGGQPEIITETVADLRPRLAEHRRRAARARPGLGRVQLLAVLDTLGVELRFNEMSGRHEIVESGGTTALTDETVRRLWLEAEQIIGRLPAYSTWRELVIAEAERHPYDPLREWIDALRWDGRRRLDGWLQRYAGAPDSELVSIAGRATLIGAVRRARQPGAKHDTMLILEGDQGIGKSRLVAALVPDPAWHTDALDLCAGPREVIEATRGCWIVEVAELDGLNRADLDRVKAMLSRSVDRARMSYARLPISVPRRWVAVGTINPRASGYLLDQTGNRRFWPVPCGRVLPEALAAEREQLWAEAAAAELTGEPNWLGYGHEREMAEEQAARTEENPLVEELGRALAGVAETTTNEALAKLGIPIERRNRALQMQAAAALQQLGWQRFRRDPRRPRLWRLPTSGQPQVG